ncbi:MAG TPA: GDP-mannose 4,6-dehydratase [Solirubrobacteraceae bacterium]|nr:GDP-mannose 4,6-dehydratase [Solirubrobacteraceae bacterium]
MTSAGRRALITGISGQDGSYLAEQLVEAGYAVHGIVRPTSSLANLAGIRDRITLHEGEFRDPASFRRALERSAPDEVYHLAAPTFVPDSWLDPAGTLEAIAVASADLLTAVREDSPGARVVVASSREIFGNPRSTPQDESTPCEPSSPYGVAKLAVHQLVGLLRDRHEMHASSAILFNHESVRRPAQFVTRKVTRAAAAISLGLEDELVLGDLDAVRDWSAAIDVMAGLRLIAGRDEPGDFVLASGVGHSVGDLVRAAFAYVDLDPAVHLRLDDALRRAPEPVDPVGDPTRARELLGWRAVISFEQLIGEMVRADLDLLA